MVRTTRRGASRAPLVGGVLAGPLFTAAWILGGKVTPGYDPMRHLVSTLALGKFGWLQVAAFFVSGLLMLRFAFGLRRALRPPGSTWGPLLIGLAGIGLLGAGVFATDPANGFPIGTPAVPTETTTHGQLHNLFAAAFLFGLALAAFVFTRYFRRAGRPGPAFGSALSGVAFFAAFLLQRFDPDPAARFGLYQRIGITIDLLWLTLLAVHALRARPRR
jgi:hypothetical protein